MGVELVEVLKEIREANATIDQRDTAIMQRIDAIEKTTNQLHLRAQRPGFGGGDRETDLEHKEARELCVMKHASSVQKNVSGVPVYVPKSDEIETARIANQAMRGLLSHGRMDRLDDLEKKSLSSFSFGSNEFILAPQWSNRVLSCLSDPSDVAGLMSQASTSGGSLKFPVDNQRMNIAGWACEANCFSNNPQPDLQAGLGELEIRVEILRFIVCASRDLLEDASFDVESWIMRKAAEGFRNAINDAVVAGDGLGRPMGILNPNAGIPVVITAPSTPPGQYTWQDLLIADL